MSEGFSHKTWISPLLAVLFVATAVSGVLMLFHLAPGGLRSMHEWIGLASVVAAGVHIALNWRCLLRYFRNRTAIVATVVAALATVAFIVFGGGDDKHHHGPRDGAASPAAEPQAVK